MINDEITVDPVSLLSDHYMHVNCPLWKVSLLLYRQRCNWWKLLCFLGPSTQQDESCYWVTSANWQGIVWCPFCLFVNGLILFLLIYFRVSNFYDDGNILHRVPFTYTPHPPPPQHSSTSCTNHFSSEIIYFNLFCIFLQEKKEKGLATMKELLRQKTYQGALSKISSPLNPSYKLRQLKYDISPLLL